MPSVQKLALVSLVLLTLGLQPALAQPGQTSVQDRAAALVEAFRKVEKSASVGISAIDLANGKILIAVNADQRRTPASNQKIVTSALAMEALGGDFNFTTCLYQAGNDLVIVGDFDPAFGDPRLADEAGKTIYADLDVWAQQVKARLGNNFAGRILTLGEKPAGGYRHGNWPASQRGHWYSAPVASLNFNNNCIDVAFTSDKKGISAIISPESKFIPVASKLSVGRKQVWSLRMNADCSAGTLTGTVSGASEPASTAIDDPPMLFARSFGQRLLEAGVAWTGQFDRLAEKDFDKSKATLVAQTSRPLAVVMARANKRSLNMAAEAMFLRACGGTWDKGAQIASDMLIKAYGLNEESFKISDGSGLSKANEISPAAITKLLLTVSRRKDARIFINSLPIAGVDGTMEKRLTREPYKGRVLGKTGYVAGASCLSGYILDPAGKPAIAFSVMVNKMVGLANAKRLEEDVCKTLVDSVNR